MSLLTAVLIELELSSSSWLSIQSQRKISLRSFSMISGTCAELCAGETLGLVPSPLLVPSCCFPDPPLQDGWWQVGTRPPSHISSKIPEKNGIPMTNSSLPQWPCGRIGVGHRSGIIRPFLIPVLLGAPADLPDRAAADPHGDHLREQGENGDRRNSWKFSRHSQKTEWLFPKVEWLFPKTELLLSKVELLLPKMEWSLPKFE